MPLRLAIIADDLTGALDTASPFACLGLSVSVAIEAEGLEEALACRPDVLAVNTASRALPPRAAAEAVRAAAHRILQSARPGIVLKKIDSRLKGNIAAESLAIAQALDLSGGVIAPAVPDQQRFVAGGALIGRGVETPLRPADLFNSVPFEVHVPDTADEADLFRLAAETDWSANLAIGARGLGQAFARLLSQTPSAGPPVTPPAFQPARRALFAFGSRDPITLAQIDRLRDARPDVSAIEAPDGQVPEVPDIDLPLVVFCSGDGPDSQEQVAARFANGITALVARTSPDLLVLGGGDTALAICRAFGARLAIPAGEGQGLPIFDLAAGPDRSLRCMVKSGGFGDADVLLRLLAAAGA